MNSEDPDILKTLNPFRQMPAGKLHAVLEKAEVQRFAAGKMVFRRAQEDTKVYWLLTGALDLLDRRFERKSCRAGDPVSRHPIDNNSPHRLTAVTSEESRVLVCERACLQTHPDKVPPSDRGDVGIEDSPPAAVVKDMGEDVDWMSGLLRSPLFEFVPPLNIQTLFNRFRKVEYGKGEAIVNQGEKGDCFYVVHSGTVRVERNLGGKQELVAELEPGDTFGQDALVSDMPRNATVTMTGDGALMRITDTDFRSLLLNPVIDTLTMEEVLDMQRQKSPAICIIDVGTPKETEEDRIPGSLNIPLFQLRNRLQALREETLYVTTCKDRKRAALGAYTLNENGFTTYVLEG